MRSPNEIYVGPKMSYQPHLFDDAYYSYMSMEANLQQNKLFRMLKACLNCCKCCKRKQKELSDDIIMDEPPLENMDEPRKMFSFAELELSKMMSLSPIQRATDAAVQTGDSLEIPKGPQERRRTMNSTQLEGNQSATFQLKQLPVRKIDNRRLAKFGATSEQSISKHIRELNMLKLLKEQRQSVDSAQRQSSVASATSYASDDLELSVHKPSYEEEEEELQSHFYDHHDHHRAHHDHRRDRHGHRRHHRHHHSHEKPATSHNLITTTCDIHSERPETSKQARKCLRFEEDTPTIRSFIEDAVDEDYEASKRNSCDPKKKDHDVENNPHSSGRDFKRFWKGKKSKKKQHSFHM